METNRQNSDMPASVVTANGITITRQQMEEAYSTLTKMKPLNYLNFDTFRENLEAALHCKLDTEELRTAVLEMCPSTNFFNNPNGYQWNNNGIIEFVPHAFRATALKRQLAGEQAVAASSATKDEQTIAPQAKVQGPSGTEAKGIKHAQSVANHANAEADTAMPTDEPLATLRSVYATLEAYSNGFRDLDLFHTKYEQQTGSSIGLDDFKKLIRGHCPRVNFWDTEKGGPFVTPSGATIDNAFRANELQDGGMKAGDKTPAPSRPLNAHQLLLQFAYFQPFGKLDGLQHAIDLLASKALPEKWSYGRGADVSHPILRNYLLLTFQRLMAEDEANRSNSMWKTKIRESADGKWVVFNTGLVDILYEPIYALFCQNINKDKQHWKFDTFVESRDVRHQEIVRIFGTDLPEPAHYYNSTSELVYDVKAEIGSFNWKHFIDHCARIPLDFLRDNVTGFDFSAEPKNAHFYKALAAHINDPANTRSFNRIKNRIEDAIAYAVKRVRWNFKTAIPIYYPTLQRISLLLPLSLTEHNDNQIDVALVLEATPSGAYIAHTILTLQMAYTNARLITRPDSDWLLAESISAHSSIAEEE